MLFRSLRDEDEIKQLFALELIENIPLTPWAKTLNELFHGDNVEVRRTVLKISAENSNVISDNELLSLLKNSDQADIAISVAGIRKLKDALPIVESYLTNPDSELQITAAAALQLMESDKTEDARLLIKDKMSSDDPKIQAMAIRHLTNQKEILTNSLLINFLEDSSEITSNACLDVAVKRKNSELIPAIITNLAYPKTLPTARYTLQQFSEDAVIEEFLIALENKEIGQNLLRGIVVTLRAFRTEIGRAHV